MKDFLKIVKENNEMKQYLGVANIVVNLNSFATNQEEAEEVLEDLLEELINLIKDLGYSVSDTDVLTVQQVNESKEKEVLNKTPDANLENDIVDIFNIVESRLRKIDANQREKAYETLKYKLSLLNINEDFEVAHDLEIYPENIEDLDLMIDVLSRYNYTATKTNDNGIVLLDVYEDGIAEIEDILNQNNIKFDY